MKIGLGKLHLLIFILIYVLVFFLTGSLQFFLGVPYVLVSLIILFLLSFIVVIYLPKWNYRNWDKVVILGFIYAFLIILSGIINQTDIVHVILYLIFPALPTLFYLFFKAGIKERTFYRRKISLILMFTACIQLPFILAQRLSYDFMKDFNRSGQALIEVDFWFGTFPFKADHALGMFLLFNILNIYWYNKKLKLTKFPWLVMIWIGITIFLTDTKITQLMLAGLFIVHAYIAVPRNIKILGIVTVVIAAITAIFFLQKIPILKQEYEYAQKAYTLEHSKATYNSGIYARRINIVIYYLNFKPLTLIGDGPYDYFNFRKGEFKKTHHFSQLIWTYNDVGLLGLVTVVLFMYYIVKSLALTRWRKWLIFLILMVYAFYTIALFDFALIIALLTILNNKFLDEPDPDTIS